ncbi:hypothetical protein TRVL_04667 [Trypanosoma vivax]|nr:hypothetical protein TRVL_04667 [Trypanosoma vivax]
MALALEASAVLTNKSCVTLRLLSVPGAGTLIHSVNQVTQHAHVRRGPHAECKSGPCISRIGYPHAISFDDTRRAFGCATKRFSSQSFQTHACAPATPSCQPLSDTTRRTGQCTYSSISHRHRTQFLSSASTHTLTRLHSSFASAAKPKLHVAAQRGQKLIATPITHCPATVLTCVNVRLAFNRFEGMGGVLLTSDRTPPVNIRNSRYFSCRHSRLFDRSVSLQKHFHTALRCQALARHRRPSSFLLHRAVKVASRSANARAVLQGGTA